LTSPLDAGVDAVSQRRQYIWSALRLDLQYIAPSSSFALNILLSSSETGMACGITDSMIFFTFSIAIPPCKSKDCEGIVKRRTSSGKKKARLPWKTCFVSLCGFFSDCFAALQPAEKHAAHFVSHLTAS